jgi:hypothetical protein
MTMLLLSRLATRPPSETFWKFAALQRHPGPGWWNAIRNQCYFNRNQAVQLRYTAGAEWYKAAYLWDITARKRCTYRNTLPNWNVTRVQGALKRR